eukprot:gene15132-4518_t
MGTTHPKEGSKEGARKEAVKLDEEDACGAFWNEGGKSREGVSLMLVGNTGIGKTQFMHQCEDGVENYQMVKLRSGKEVTPLDLPPSRKDTAKLTHRRENEWDPNFMTYDYLPQTNLEMLHGYQYAGKDYSICSNYFMYKWWNL